MRYDQSDVARRVSSAAYCLSDMADLRLEGGAPADLGPRLDPLGLSGFFFLFSFCMLKWSSGSDGGGAAVLALVYFHLEPSTLLFT